MEEGDSPVFSNSLINTGNITPLGTGLVISQIRMHALWHPLASWINFFEATGWDNA